MKLLELYRPGPDPKLTDPITRLWPARAGDKEPAAVSLLHKKLQPIGAGSGYGIASLLLPGHPIPATLFNGLSSLPAIDFPEGFEFLVGVGLLHELGDADRRLAGPPSAGAGGCPATPRMKPGATVLDVACRTGASAMPLRAADVPYDPRASPDSHRPDRPTVR